MTISSGRDRQGRGRAGARRLPSPARRRQERGRRASSRTPASRPTRCARDLQQRAEAEIAEMRQRAAADVESAKQQAIADLRSEVARWPSARPRSSCSRTSTATPIAADRELHQPGRERRQLMSGRDRRRIGATPRPCSRSRRPKGSSARSKTSCPLRPRPEVPTSCATRSPIRTSRRRRQQIVEDLLGARATAVTTALVSMVVGAGRATTCRPSSTSSSS